MCSHQNLRILIKFGDLAIIMFAVLKVLQIEKTLSHDTKNVREICKPSALEILKKLGKLWNFRA